MVPVGAELPDEKLIIEEMLKEKFPNIQIEMSSKSVNPPLSMFNEETRQYDAKKVLKELEKVSNDKQTRVIDISILDITSPPLNFVFSTVDKTSNVMFMSYFRFGKRKNHPIGD